VDIVHRLWSHPLVKAVIAAVGLYTMWTGSTGRHLFWTVGPRWINEGSRWSVIAGFAVVVLAVGPQARRRLPWQRRVRSPHRQSIFPDIEFEIRMKGFRTADAHPLTAAPFPSQIVLLGLRITSHETARRVSLTFRIELSLDEKGAWSGFGDSVPLAPITVMPIDLAPQSSEATILEFDRGIVPDSALGPGGMIVKVEDHLSGLCTPLPPMGTWRPTKDGEWTGAFPAPPPSPGEPADKPEAAK
jgi:hypothetical protein